MGRMMWLQRSVAPPPKNKNKTKQNKTKQTPVKPDPTAQLCPRSLHATHPSTIMPSCHPESNLHNPALFTPEHKPIYELVDEYLAIVKVGTRPCVLPTTTPVICVPQCRSFAAVVTLALTRGICPKFATGHADALELRESACL